MKRGSLTLAIAGLALALTASAAGAADIAPGAGPAQAQPPAQADQADRHAKHAQHMKEMCDNADAHHMAAIARAEARLKLTDAQKPAWSKFVEAASTAHQAMTKLMCATIEAKQGRQPLPERLARAEEMAKAKLTHIQTIRPALEELYKVLAPEQQKTADTLPLANLGQGQGHGHGQHHKPQGTEAR